MDTEIALWLIIGGAYIAGGINAWISKDKDGGYTFSILKIVFMGMSLFLLYRIALGLLNG